MDLILLAILAVEYFILQLRITVAGSSITAVSTIRMQIWLDWNKIYSEAKSVLT